MRVRSRRPRFGDIVVLGPTRLRVVASVVAPARGYVVRPDGAKDAAADRVFTLQDWGTLVWDSAAQRWEAA